MKYDGEGVRAPFFVAMGKTFSGACSACPNWAEGGGRISSSIINQLPDIFDPPKPGPPLKEKTEAAAEKVSSKSIKERRNNDSDGKEARKIR